MSVKVSRGVVTKDGDVLPMSVLERYATKAHHPGSKQTKDTFGKLYETSGLVQPLYDPVMLTQMLDLNTYHKRSCGTKAHDSVGLGYHFEAREGVENPSENEKERAQNFFDNCHPINTFNEVLKRAAFDFEATGDGYIELIKDENDFLIGIEHIPSHTVRRHRDGERYCQKRGASEVWFKHWGSDIELTRDGITETPESHEEKANEIIHVSNYTSRSDYYGAPDVIPALGAMLADYERMEYNSDFFKNHAVPAYAVTVVGAELDDETEDAIKHFFQNDLKENRHATLVMSVSKSELSQNNEPIEIQFEPLSVDVKEASFRLFRQDNRDEILSAHGVPPYRIAVNETGSLGGNTARESTEIYKQSILESRQNLWESKINRFILQGELDVHDWVLKFDEIDTRDDEREVKISKEYFNMASLSPNEVRGRLGLERVEHPAMDYHYINGKPIELMGSTTQSIDSNDSIDLLGSIKSLHNDLVNIAIKGSDDDV